MPINRSAIISANISISGLKLEWGGLGLRIDPEGRWCSFHSDSGYYRRCIDGEVVRYGEKLQCCSVPQAEALLGEIHTLVDRVLVVIEDLQALHLVTGTPQQLQALLLSCRQRSRDAYREDAERYSQVYLEKVPILPPDRYRDLVVLPAVGCPNHKCTFCAFYRDKPFRPFTPLQLDHHIDGLKQLFGKALAGRNGIFLGSANAMALSQRRLLLALTRIEEAFELPKRGIASFFDPYYSPRRPPAQWRELAGHGVVRLVIGLETGLPLLRQQLGKNPDTTPLQAAVAQAKEAGIQVGITVLVGAGGEPLARRHVEQTVAVLRPLDLDRRDLIYLSPLELEAEARAEALDSLLTGPPGAPSGTLIEEQLTQFYQQLQPVTAAKVMTYQIDRYRYYS